MDNTILCEALYDGGFPAKVMYYEYAEGSCDKNNYIIREEMEIKKGRLYFVAKKVIDAWERGHKIAISKKDVGGVYNAYKKLLWKRVK